jgi:hypothetical protein
MVKQTLKRKQPNFSEGYYGYRNFSHLLEHAAEQGLLQVEENTRSGGYKVLGLGRGYEE